MPLRDHFRPPVEDEHSWDALHGMWPALIVLQLSRLLPDEFTAGPRIHLGTVLETGPPHHDEYEVCIRDARHGRRLVAAVEIVSPSNKDSPEGRRASVAKVAALIQHGVCVTIVDVVTICPFNLYVDLKEHLSGGNLLGAGPPATYAFTARGRHRDDGRLVLETWFSPMTPGQPLPRAPIWLESDRGIPLDLEASYEEACRALRIA